MDGGGTGRGTSSCLSGDMPDMADMPEPACGGLCPVCSAFTPTPGFRCSIFTELYSLFTPGAASLLSGAGDTATGVTGYGTHGTPPTPPTPEIPCNPGTPNTPGNPATPGTPNIAAMRGTPVGMETPNAPAQGTAPFKGVTSGVHEALAACDVPPTSGDGVPYTSDGSCRRRTRCESRPSSSYTQKAYKYTVTEIQSPWLNSTTGKTSTLW